MYTLDVNRELLSIISTLRNQMIQTAQKEGLASETTLKISQELDYYILKYQINKN